MSNGKGDTPRPLSVPKYEFDAAWERTFNKGEPCSPSPAGSSSPTSSSPSSTDSSTAVVGKEHRCGVNGFNGMLGDVCPACEHRNKQTRSRSGAGRT